ncbi:MAG TPA: cellulase N-terminal Ig-like domain-containing protein, partial [Patescibacteria group bacterium]|nr:cellulase N-terminal Ig-like domain-containing protein [Patescibacteria group bacterium]
MRASSVVGAILTAILVLPSVLVTTALATAPTGTTAGGEPSVQGAIRLDQLGYAPSEHKVAYVIATASVAGARFSVRN